MADTDLDALSTEELRERAFARARGRHDLRFFWDLLQRQKSAQDSETVDGSLGSLGTSIEEAVGLWREMTGHDYGDREPLIRAAFVDYLRRHPE